jgi:ABC-type branched-subunit amino acid transport system substrate-binding protein
LKVEVAVFFTKSRVITLLFAIIILFALMVWVLSQQTANVSNNAVPTVIQDRQSLSADGEAQSSAQVASASLQAACGQLTFTTAQEIVIGALAPLSKPGAMQSGFAMQTAFNIAIDEINTQGGIAGKPARLLAYDTAGLPEQGARFAERLISQDCASILVGVYHSNVALAVKEVVHHLGTPVIFADPYADEITADHWPEIFRIAPTGSMLAQMPAQWMAEVGDYNRDGEKQVAIVAENSPYNAAKLELMQHWMAVNGFKTEIIQVDLPTTDFNAVVARVVAFDHMPDAIFLQIHGNTVYDLQSALLNAGIGPQKNTLLVSNLTAIDDDNFWARLPEGVNTVMPKIGPWPATIGKKGRAFAEKYHVYANRWPEAYAFEAYDAVLLAADAISRTHSLAPRDLISALEATDIELAAGHYTFPYNSKHPPNGADEPAYLWHQWPNPPLFYLQYTAANQKASQAAIIWPPQARTSPTPIQRATPQSP